MAYKKERLEKTIEKEITMILFNDVKDDRLHFVTITNVDLTNDLSIATVFYRVMGTDAQIENTTNVLLEAKGFIKSVLAKRIQIRKIPDLIFKYDHSFEQGERIEALLKDIKYYTEEDK